MIENVARAICRADPEVRMGDADRVVEQRVNIEWVHYVGAAKAAIAAMTVHSEPVAWKNYAEDGDWWLTDDREPADSCERSVPLYAFPTPPAAGGSDAE